MKRAPSALDGPDADDLGLKGDQAPTDEWFVVGEATADGTFWVLHMARASLPETTVVAGPFVDRADAEAVAQARAEARGTA